MAMSEQRRACRGLKLQPWTTAVRLDPGVRSACCQAQVPACGQPRGRTGLLPGFLCTFGGRPGEGGHVGASQCCTWLLWCKTVVTPQIERP